MRFMVVERSQSGHCCFEFTVVDTDSPYMINGEQYNGQFNSVCECFNKRDAIVIAIALNATSNKATVRENQGMD